MRASPHGARPPIVSLQQRNRVCFEVAPSYCEAFPRRQFPPKKMHKSGLLLVAFLAAVVSAPFARAQLLEFEKEPVRYHETEATDPVAQLKTRLAAGEASLPYDEQFGYLPALLDALDIRQESQVLVFSKTSLQLHRISPRRPRAVYFNDTTYIGSVQFSDVIEISTTDAQLGGVFYTLRQDRESPRLVRDKGQCLTCHSSSRTKGVPGHLVRSVFAGSSGQPLFGSGTRLSDHTSQFSKRFGGWYVTGTHGDMRHMGNVQVLDRTRPEYLDRERGANVTDLTELLDTSKYLQPTSDLVALMVLEHQTQMHNYITLANMETRAALHYNSAINKALERPADHLSESTQRRIQSVAEKLVRYMLFSEEFKLQSPVAGVTSFADTFSARGPRDKQGRSLYQLDLDSRLLKYPCSWLIYSDAFDQLPTTVYDHVAHRLHEILTGDDTSEPFSHLTRTDRRAIREILEETKPTLAAAWD